MRTRLSLMAAAVLLVAAGARAQQDASKAAPAVSSVADTGLLNQVDFGVRGTSFGANSDEARFQHYRDLRDGGSLDLFRFHKDTDQWLATLQADHVGYRDQRYSGAYNNYGKVKASFEWNQIPLFYSQDTRTLFTASAPGVLRLDDGIQSGIQNRTLTLATVAGQAQPFDLRVRRDVADFKVVVTAARDLDLSFSAKNTRKNGNQQWGATFGFGDAVEVPVPIDTRTTELGAALEWANQRGLIRLGYDGSFFRNSVTTLVWDNPQRISDSPTAGPSQGRMALWPNSDLNAASATGSMALPGRSRATAYLSVGNWSQNDPLIPFTINSAITPISLDRTTAEAQARVTAMNYNFTSRPTAVIWFSARYRSYDFDNRTPVFHVTNTVRYDTLLAPFTEAGTTPFSYTRQTFDGDVSLTPLKYAAFRMGYTREQVDRTFRLFETTTEETIRASVDSAGLAWLTVRGVYEHARRVGTGLDEQALDDIGEQVSLRQFDISDRNSDRFSGIVQVMPVSQFSLNASVSVGKESRPGAVFGLRSNDNRAYSVGVDVVPRDSVSLGVQYGYEEYTALQASRQANPGAQFNDPTRDWTTDTSDKVHTLTASMDLLKLWPKTEIRFAYDYSHAQSVYVYGLTTNTPLPPVVQLTPVVNELQRGTADARYFLTRHVGLGLVYWYDKYRVSDFALGPQTIDSIAQPSFMVLGYVYRPYTANTVMGKLTYRW